jgi:macrodomain Ter protein organizer (MatP/YcbG family)
MARPKYCITAADLLHVELYLGDKLRTYNIEFSEGVSLATVEKKCDVAIGHKSKTKRSEAMNTWCERYLSTTEWNKLKSAIRKRRARWERYGESTTIAVSTKVHEYLVKISERDKVTYNDILEHVLSKAWSGSRAIPKRSAGKSRRRR